jgi:hypothetical protein
MSETTRTILLLLLLCCALGYILWVRTNIDTNFSYNADTDIVLVSHFDDLD